MATVSHLPHVIANVLVSAGGRGGGPRSPSACPRSARASATPPGSLGRTRRSGGDIFATNRDAVAREVDSVSERLREAAELIRVGGRGAGRRLARRRPASTAVACWRPIWSVASSYQLRLSVDNRPGTVAEIALALGRAGVNIEDMALYPAPRHEHRRGLAVGRRERAEAERAAEIVRGLGHNVLSRPSAVTRVRPILAASRYAATPARQVDQATAQRDGGDGEGAYGDEELSRRRRIPGHPGAIQVIGAEVEELGPSSGAVGNDLRVGGIGLRGPGERFAEGAQPVALDVGNAGTLLRLLPGWLAGQGRGAWTLDGDESIGAPSRGPGCGAAADDGGPGSSAAMAACPRFASRVRRCVASPTSFRWPAPRSSRAS